MRRIVVKLGSSVVADGGGEPRMEVLARVCDAVAQVHGDGGEVVLVTSGAIARGARGMGLGQRPTTIGDLQAASAGGQGKPDLIYGAVLRAGGLTSGQVGVAFFHITPRTTHPHARQT